MPISKRLAMSPDQLNDLMMNTWNMRIATIGPGVEINLTPMWFGWAEGKIFTFGRGQKVVNVRRNPVCGIIVDLKSGSRSYKLLCFKGEPGCETSAEEQAEPGMDKIREQMGLKYAGGMESLSSGRSSESRDGSRRVRSLDCLYPNKQITDNFKLPRADG